MYSACMQFKVLYSIVLVLWLLLGGPSVADLWVSTPNDPFPDPDKDYAGFLDYCSEVNDVSTVSLYFLTRDMIESGLEIKPLVIEMPIVVSKLGTLITRKILTFLYNIFHLIVKVGNFIDTDNAFTPVLTSFSLYFYI